MLIELRNVGVTLTVCFDVVLVLEEFIVGSSKRGRPGRRTHAANTRSSTFVATGTAVVNVVLQVSACSAAVSKTALATQP